MAEGEHGSWAYRVGELLPDEQEHVPRSARVLSALARLAATRGQDDVARSLEGRASRALAGEDAAVSSRRRREILVLEDRRLGGFARARSAYDDGDSWGVVAEYEALVRDGIALPPCEHAIYAAASYVVGGDPQETLRPVLVGVTPDLVRVLPTRVALWVVRTVLDLGSEQVGDLTFPLGAHLPRSEPRLRADIFLLAIDVALAVGRPDLASSSFARLRDLMTRFTVVDDALWGACGVVDARLRHAAGSLEIAALAGRVPPVHRAALLVDLGRFAEADLLLAEAHRQLDPRAARGPAACPILRLHYWVCVALERPKRARALAEQHAAIVRAWL